MNSYKAVFAGISGTTGMTIFSYFLSGKKDKNFREPDLLAYTIQSILPRAGTSGSRVAGWITHYMAGIFFAEIYKAFVNQKTIQHTGNHH